MNQIKHYRILFLIAIAFIFVACSNSQELATDSDSSASSESIVADPSSAQEDEPDPTVAPTDEPTTTPEPTKEPTATPEPTEEPTNAPEPTAEPTPANEPVDSGQDSEGASSSESIAGGPVTVFEGEVVPITVEYPESWSVTEDPSFGILIESSEGLFGQLPSVDGAALVVLPRDAADLDGENVTAKLLSAILTFRLPSTAELNDPEVTSSEGHDYAVSEFEDVENSVDGFFAVVTNGDQAAIVFAATGGTDRVDYSRVLSTIISSVMLTNPE